jgi:electron transport complex protein RnfB
MGRYIFLIRKINWPGYLYTKEKNMEETKMNRRGFLKKGLQAIFGLTIAGITGFSLFKKPSTSATDTVWQIDPNLCIQCGGCEENCVLSPSAVKCVHNFAMCGYCDLCSGYLRQDPKELSTGAENRLCPTGAITRSFVEDPYFEYVIDESLCTGCGKCVKGCTSFGNGALFLQIRHNRCVNCNECSIARQCPASAISRIPASNPYLLKGVNV